VKLVALPSSISIDERKIPFGIRTVELDLRDKKF
jgi:hypothetical protein